MSEKMKRDLSGLKSKVGNLLTPAEIAAQIRAISPEREDVSKSQEVGGEVKANGYVRRKYTTMLAPDLIFELKRKALDKGISAADLLEIILRNHL
jgi:hypothetical protein